MLAAFVCCASVLSEYGYFELRMSPLQVLPEVKKELLRSMSLFVGTHLQEGMRLPQSQVEDIMGRGPAEAKYARQESCMPAHTTTSSASRRSMNRRTKRAPQRAVI